MDINHYKQYEPIFGVWHITRLIGEGSFGKVFELERDDFGVHYKAALKAITIPASKSEVDELMAEMTDEASVRDYYSTFIRELVEESALMSRLKGNSNIVSYENHQVIEHKDGIGWDVLIQMELLTPLNQYTKGHTITRQDIIKLGIDMCKALELCQKFNIIHRDLKPENIFISESGDFKLGDFGIARTVEKTTGGLSKKGTYNYMAPEVYKGESYGSTVDIYSLGIVLYRLLNENRTPFLPAYPAPITHRDRENALSKRFSGAPLPPPAHGDGRLGEIVLKACSYDSKDRYSSPAQMRQELEAILYSQGEASYIYPEGDQVEQKSVEYVATGEEAQSPHYEGTQRDGSIGGNYQGRGTDNNFEDQDGKTVSDFGMRADGTISDFGNRDGSRTSSYGPQSQNMANNFGRTTGQDRKQPASHRKMKTVMITVCIIVLLSCIAIPFAFEIPIGKKVNEALNNAMAGLKGNVSSGQTEDEVMAEAWYEVWEKLQSSLKPEYQNFTMNPSDYIVQLQQVGYGEVSDVQRTDSDNAYVTLNPMDNELSVRCRMEVFFDDGQTAVMQAGWLWNDSMQACESRERVTTFTDSLPFSSRFYEDHLNMNTLYSHFGITQEMLDWASGYDGKFFGNNLTVSYDADNKAIDIEDHSEDSTDSPCGFVLQTISDRKWYFAVGYHQEMWVNPDKQADFQEKSETSLTEDEMEEEWLRVWENITSDLQGYEYMGTWTPMEYASFLQINGFCFLSRDFDGSAEPVWKGDQIQAIPNAGADSFISFYANSDLDSISAICFSYHGDSAGIETMNLVTPLPCGIQFDDSFDVISKKLGITQEMLKEDENGEINFSSDELCCFCKERIIENLYTLNELWLQTFLAEEGYLERVFITVIQYEDGRQTLNFELSYAN